MRSSATAIDASTPSAEDRAILALDDAIRSESRLLRELVALLKRQRRGVAEDDLELVDESVHGAQRILLTLAEARRRRRSLLDLAGGPSDGPLGELAHVLGRRMTESLRAAVADLQEAARRLAQELRTNREILEHAIRSGEHHVRTLYGAGRGSGYGPDALETSPDGGGRLLNRTV